MRRTHYQEDTLMRKAIKTLVLVAAMAAAITVALPAKADAGYHFRRGFYGRGFYGHGFYGRGFYGRGFYGRGFYGRGFYGRGFGGYGPYGYGANRYVNSGAVRIEVQPKYARDEMAVYVDEAQAGVVDNFDGAFQRLYLPPGKHEIEIRLDGYQPLRQVVFVTAGSTYHIRGRLRALAAD